MFNLGFTELLLLGVIALIFIGPNQLPEVARTLGRLLNEWKRATSDFQSTMTANFTEDVQQRWQDAREQNADHQIAPPTDHSIAEKVETETPDGSALPEGVAPVANPHRGENS